MYYSPIATKFISNKINKEDFTKACVTSTFQLQLQLQLQPFETGMRVKTRDLSLTAITDMDKIKLVLWEFSALK